MGPCAPAAVICVQTSSHVADRGSSVLLCPEMCLLSKEVSLSSCGLPVDVHPRIPINILAPFTNIRALCFYANEV